MHKYVDKRYMAAFNSTTSQVWEPGWRAVIKRILALLVMCRTLF